MSKVLFTSRRPLGRCENITAVYKAYKGDKEFIQENWKGRINPRIYSSDFNVMVADEFVSYSPGRLILIGHGISGGKSYGLDQPHGYHKQKKADIIDYAVCTSQDTIKLTADNAGIPEYRTLPLGMPRTDSYIGKHKGDGGTFLKGKRAYLFAPTFRNSHEPPMPEINWLKIDQMLNENEIFVVKPHMVTGRILDSNIKYNHIVEVLSTLPSTPFLIDCDVLITDYSTILFDGHLLGKPVVLFEKETGFVETRGMYFDYPSGYSSRYVTNEEDLIKLIRGAQFPQNEDIMCLERACGACDGHSTERVVELIEKVVKIDKAAKKYFYKQMEACL